MLVTLLLLPKKKSFYVTFFLLHYFTDNQKKARYNIRNRVTFYKKNLAKHLLIQKKYLPLHPQSRNKHSKSEKETETFHQMMARSSIG